MDINDALGKTAREAGAEDLHVARQDDQFDLLRGKQLDLAALGFGFVLRRDRNNVEGDAVEIGVALGIGMVAQDQGDFAGEFTAVMAVEQIAHRPRVAVFVSKLDHCLVDSTRQRNRAGSAAWC